MRNRLLPLIMISSAIAIAADQTTSRDGSAAVPVMGYSFGEQTRELRAILGVPGASTWSDPLALPEGVSDLRLAPGHRWALLLREGGEAGILELDSLRYRAIADRLESLDGVRFSPSSKAMVLPSGAVYRGLPGDPSKAGSAAAGNGALAVSDEGMVAVVQDGRLMQGAEFLRACSESCRFAYFPGADSRLAVLDGGRLMEVAGSESRVIAEQLEDVSLMLASERSVVLASASSLRIIERESGVLARQEDLPAPPSRLESMRHSGALLLSRSSNEAEASWLFAQEGVRFVPARVAQPAGEVKE